MKLLSVELENIRSYKHGRVDFSDGVTLLEGDIGCGKSSLLYAIEFALFGLGDLNASFLLRNTANSGWVKLAFSVDERNCVVYRSLERKKESVQQGNGWLEENGVRKDFAPSEIKPAILKILGFKESPSPKSLSTIYRYAVFTPQEEMKRILEEKTEDRMQTLRKAFGIEEYRQARENSELVRKVVRDQTKFIEGGLGELDGLLSEKKTLEKQLIGALDAENKFGALSQALSNELDVLKAHLKKLAEKKSAFEKLSAELPLIDRQLSEKQKQLARLQSSLKDALLEKTSVETQLKAIALPEVAPDLPGLEKNVSDLRMQAESVSSALGVIETRLGDYVSLKKTGECPTCGQALSSDFSEKVAELTGHATEKRALLSELKKTEAKAQVGLDDARAFALKKKRFDDLSLRLKTMAVQDAENNLQCDALGKELPALENELKTKRTALEKEKPAIAELQSAEKAADEKEFDLRKALQAKSAADSEVKNLGERFVSIERKLEEKEKQKLALNALNGRSSWLEEFFSPALSTIESHVMLGLSQDFDNLFRKWFSLLVESDELSVASNERFEPLVEINGYEQSFQTLSGGEKSALALAYRLALNSVVRTTATSMKDNLLILDEPTDGFSKEQLARMRDVFLQLDCKQVLLVSHERELEAFANKIYKIEKSGGESHVLS
ncbi:MAG: AAA family ATPase [Candidatus Micrarchaeota archaeon]